MSKHTPGPWYLEELPIGYIINRGPDPFDEQITDHVYTKENARLIAAAPDLLEALEAAEPMMLECMYIGGVTEAGADCMAKVRAAIARARGEA